MKPEWEIFYSFLLIISRHILNFSTYFLIFSNIFENLYGCTISCFCFYAQHIKAAQNHFLIKPNKKIMDCTAFKHPEYKGKHKFMLTFSRLYGRYMPRGSWSRTRIHRAQVVFRARHRLFPSRHAFPAERKDRRPSWQIARGIFKFLCCAEWRTGY